MIGPDQLGFKLVPILHQLGATRFRHEATLETKRLMANKYNFLINLKKHPSL
jgi:hypothetical protein